MIDPHEKYYRIFELTDPDLEKLIRQIPEEELYRATVTMPNTFLNKLSNIVSPELWTRIKKQQVDHEPFILISDVNKSQFFIGDLIETMFPKES